MDDRSDKKIQSSRNRSADEMSAVQLVKETGREASHLIQTEIALAKAELREDLKSEVTAAKGLSVALVCGLSVVNLLFVSAAFALTPVLPPWSAPLVVAGVVALGGTAAGVFGWKHIKTPLTRTRQSLEKNVHWIKQETT